MSGNLSQFAIVNEVTYGTPVTVTRFFEVTDPVQIHPMWGRAEANIQRSGDRVERSDKFVPFKRGGEATLTMPVPTKGFGIWLVHLLGTSATVGPTDSNYTHTGTVGSLLGDFFTAQTGLQFTRSATVQQFTGEGGKVTSWEFTCDRDGLLQVTIEMDFEDVNTSTALATASYTASATVFAHAAAAVTIGGSSVEMKNLTISGDNGLDTDGRFMRGNGLKKEPIENAKREITFSGDLEFTSNAQYDRYVSATAAGSQAALVWTCTGPIIHAGATLPSIVFTIPSARIDNVDISTSGSENHMQTMSGVARYDGTNSPISIAYTTNDATA